MALLAIEFHPEAIAEAHDTREWYAERSEAAAERFMDELLGNMLIVIDKDAEPCTYDSIFGRSDSPVCPYCYIYLQEGVDAKDVISRLKTLARETADKPLS